MDKASEDEDSTSTTSKPLAGVGFLGKIAAGKPSTPQAMSAGAKPSLQRGPAGASSPSDLEIGDLVPPSERAEELEPQPDAPAELSRKRMASPMPQAVSKPAAKPEVRQPQPEPQTVQVIQRKATVRYYEQMNPGRSYPMTVYLTKEKMAAIRLEKVAQKEGSKSIQVTPEKPEILIVPSFSGCLVSPPNMTLDVTPENTHADFWLTPIIEGNIYGWIDLVYQGKTIERISLTTKSVKQTLAKIGTALAIASPILSWAVETFLKTQLGVPDKLMLILGLVGTVVFVGVSTYFYRRNQPKEAEDIEKVLHGI